MHTVTLAAYHKASLHAGADNMAASWGRKLQLRVNYENYQTCLIRMLRRARGKQYCASKFNPAPAPESKLQQAGESTRARPWS